MKVRKLFQNQPEITLTFLQMEVNDPIELPYYDDGVQAGFPSPADDFKELTISFDKEVFGNSPSTTFCARVTGSSMKDAGIHDGDVIVVDRLLEPQTGDIAVCVINSEFTLKFIKIEKDCVWLVPANDSFQAIKVTEDEDFSVWGIVTHTLKYHRRKK